MSGQRLRTFQVIDEFSHESLAIEVDTNIPTDNVLRRLKEYNEERPAEDLAAHSPCEISIFGWN